MITETIPLWEGRKDVVLHTYLARHYPPAVPGPKEKLPAVLICPGGAYLFCSMGDEGDGVAMAFAAGGYQAFILEYTVASKAAGHDTKHPAQLLDLGKAVLTIRANAGRWHIDPERICLIGFSAGANLCGNYATQWHEPWFGGQLGVVPANLRPMAAILGYGLLDYCFQARQGESGADPGLPATNKVLFGTDAPTREQLEAASPCLHVSEHTPPIFMMHAVNDTLVPVTHSVRMFQALQEHGIPCEMHLFQGGEHGFGTGNTWPGAYRADRRKPCGAWVELAKTWLMGLVAPETRQPDVSCAQWFQGGMEPPEL